MADPNATRDKKGREFKIGDVVKVYHYTARQRREKRYMYKQVTGEWYDGDAWYLSHLDLHHEVGNVDSGYFLWKNKGILTAYEIVQSLKDDHRERPVLTVDQGGQDNG